jgi:cytochrome c556
MIKNVMSTAIVVAGLLLVACSRPDPEQATAPAPAASTVIQIMNASIIPQSTVIWELSGNLYDDDGNIDAARLTGEQWKQVEEAATAMGAGAKLLAETSGLKVAPEGAKIQSEGEEGAAGAAEVQAVIDADPQGFSEHGMQLVAIAGEIAAAAKARDGTVTDDASGRLTDVCGACHAQYWYPKQQ